MNRAIRPWLRQIPWNREWFMGRDWRPRTAVVWGVAFGYVLWLYGPGFLDWPLRLSVVVAVVGGLLKFEPPPKTASRKRLIPGALLGAGAEGLAIASLATAVQAWRQVELSNFVEGVGWASLAILAALATNAVLLLIGRLPHD